MTHRRRVAILCLTLLAALTCCDSQPRDNEHKTTLVARGSVWRFRDTGGDQGAAWRRNGFDDSEWSMGAAPLGYGSGDEATVVSFGGDLLQKHITTYFRQAFTVDHAGSIRRLELRTVSDDGVVVYLNGVEVFRANLPDTEITATTLAGASVDERQVPERSATFVDPAVLSDGINVLSAEIHQASPSGSNIRFDLEMTGSDRPVNVTRGPYLQMGTSTSVIVRWATEPATLSRLQYGSAVGSLSHAISDATISTDHALTLKNLTPGTRYSYAVATGGTPPNDASTYTFETAPLPGARSQVRIWVIGDSGTADANARAVRDAYAAVTGPLPTDVWLMLGDNAYSDVGATYQSAVFETYAQLLHRTVVWPTLGNHDLVWANAATQSGPYFDLFTLPTMAEAGGAASGSEAYYSFDYANIHFVSLDSHQSDPSPHGPMLTWLRKDLGESHADWTIAYTHFPPYSKGRHDSDLEEPSIAVRENALPILEDHGVDLVLTGHSHSYQRSILIDGHYGPSSSFGTAMVVDAGDGRPNGNGAYRKVTRGPAAHEGTVFAVVGSSAQVQPGVLDHPVMSVGFLELGSLVLVVDGDRLDASFIDRFGRERDHFRIVKGDQPAG